LFFDMDLYGYKNHAEYKSKAANVYMRQYKDNIAYFYFLVTMLTFQGTERRTQTQRIYCITLMTLNSSFI